MNPKAMRVVHVTTVHPRHDVRIAFKECASLSVAGYEVVLIVGDGLGNDRVGGVHILDIGRAPRSRLTRMWVQTKRALALVRALQPQLVHVHDPELLPVAMRLAAQGMLVVYDAHEDVPRQILDKEWLPVFLRGMISWGFELFENRVVAKLAAVVAATPHIKDRFLQIQRRTVNVGNYPLPHELVSWGNESIERERAICYVGNISRSRGAREIVRMMEFLPDVTLLLCGLFEDDALEAELRAMQGWARVEYLGQVGRHDVGRVLRRSSIGMVTLLPTPSYRESLPIKMFEYMSAQLPVVASDFVLWQRLLEETQCGICVDPHNPHAMAAAVLTVLSDPDLGRSMGRAGQRAVQTMYNWSNEEQKLLALYHCLLCEGAERPSIALA